MLLAAIGVLFSAPEEVRVHEPASLIAGSISDMDYPASAIRANAQGTSTIRLKIGTDGNVTDCRIASSAGHPDLDETSCRIATMRFRFQPARNRAGAAVESTTTRRITWRMPQDVPPGATVSPAPLIQFVAGEVRRTLGGPADQRPRCAVEFVGATFANQEAIACFGFDRATPAELADSPVLQTVVTRLQPQGDPAPPLRSAAPGDLVGIVEATVEVDPQGLVRACTPVVPATPSPTQIPHICDGIAFGMQAFLPIGGTANRRAAVRREIRLRSAAPQTPRT